MQKDCCAGKRSSDNGHHMRVSDLMAKSVPQTAVDKLSDHTQNDWDPSEAVECILAKVRDLPSQLCSFMKVSLNLSWYLCAQESPYALHPISQEFPQCCLWNSSNGGLVNDGPFSSSQGISLSASSFYTSLLQAVDGVMSLALYIRLTPKVVMWPPKQWEIIFLKRHEHVC